jgi:hypothetical protein
VRGGNDNGKTVALSFNMNELSTKNIFPLSGGNIFGVRPIADRFSVCCFDVKGGGTALQQRSKRFLSVRSPHKSSVRNEIEGHLPGALSLLRFLVLT